MASGTTTKDIDLTTSWMDTPPRQPWLRHVNAKIIADMPWLDKVAEPVQQWAHKLFGKPEEPAYKAKDALAGVQMGHPIHPAMVTIPIGAWTAATLFDVIWLANKDTSMARSADIMMWLGMAGAVGSAATGLSNWVDLDGQERRTGIWHALLNSSVTALNVASIVLRITGQRKTAIALSSTAYTVAAYSSYIGGELAYSTAVGVNRVAGEGGSDEFVAVLDEKELQQKKPTRVDAAGVPVVLIRDGSSIYAIAATCSHLGGPLDEGEYNDGVIRCPWHNSGFRMCDGGVVNSPAVYAQPTFAVRIRNGKIELRRLEHA